jgi:hypothetical protein
VTSVNLGLFLVKEKQDVSHANNVTGKEKKELLLYAHTHQSILGVAGYIILTRAGANQLFMGRKIWSLSYSGFEPATTLTNCATRAYMPDLERDTAVAGLVDT